MSSHPSRAIQFAQQARLPLVHVHGPHLLVWARDITCGVRNFSCRVEFTAARIDNRAAVGCEPQTRERHAVVGGIMGRLPGRKDGRLRNPNIAHPFGLESPGDTRSTSGCCQALREWRAHDLLDGEALRLSNGWSGKGAGCAN